MNALQSFMAGCFAQIDEKIKEPVQINGSVVMGTFGDPQIMPVMTRNGSEDHIVTTLQVARSAFAGKDVPSKVSLTRPATSRTFFIQAVDDTHPVVFTFILTDREL